MSTRVVGYEGEGRNRRPIRIDEGPASVRVVSDIGMGKAGLIAGIPDRDLSGGAGEIERRQISGVERVARAEVRPLNDARLRRRGRQGAPPPAPQEEDLAVAEAAHIVSTELPTEPVEAEVEAPETGLAVLADAVVEAMEAEGELAQAEQLRDQAAIRWQQARAALDAAYRALDDPPAAVEWPAEYAETIPVAEPPPAPRPPNTKIHHTSGGHAKQNAEVAERAKRVLEALDRHAGDVGATAAELGMRRNGVTMIVKAARQRELKPLGATT